VAIRDADVSDGPSKPCSGLVVAGGAQRRSSIPRALPRSGLDPGRARGGLMQRQGSHRYSRGVRWKLTRLRLATRGRVRYAAAPAPVSVSVPYVCMRWWFLGEGRGMHENRASANSLRSYTGLACGGRVLGNISLPQEAQAQCALWVRPKEGSQDERAYDNACNRGRDRIVSATRDDGTRAR
jgi:hypothetical protein